MFCRNCGAQVTEGNKFCRSCGAEIVARPTVQRPQQTQQTQQSQNVRYNYNPAPVQASQNAGYAAFGSNLGQLKNLFFICLVVLVLSMIFSFTEVFKAYSNLGNSETIGMLGSSSEENFKGLDFVLYGGSIIVMCLPLITKKEIKKINLLPAKITTILNLSWFLLVFLLTLSDVNSSGLSSFGGIGISIMGWFFLATTVGSIFLLFKLSGQIKRGYM